MEPTRTTPAEAPVFTGCCPPFDPVPWQEREVSWRDHLFVKEHVTSIFHVPINMGRKIVRAVEKIDAAGAEPPQRLMLSDEKSPWGADLYIEVTKPVPGAEMATLSGRFLTKVYEGPYRDAPKWVDDMKRWVAARGYKPGKMYFAYTTCPGCAEIYGHNYVVLFARVADA